MSSNVGLRLDDIQHRHNAWTIWATAAACVALDRLRSCPAAARYSVAEREDRFGVAACAGDIGGAGQAIDRDA
jgi:hypothetical protein